MQTSQNGYDLIKRFEGLRLSAYKAVSSEQYYTIGYGHYAKNINRTDVITEDQANWYLVLDVAKCQDALNKYQKIYNFNQNQYDALIDFCFNLGSGNLDKLTNNGKRTITSIAQHITLYNKAGGRVLQGLVNRRLAEYKLFTTPVGSLKSNDEIAQEVIDDKWGNGNDRKTRLTNAGYDYKTIQALVNKKLKG